MKQLLFALLLAAFGYAGQAQNEIHLNGNDSVIIFAKAKHFNERISYSTPENPNLFKTFLLKDVDYIRFGKKFRGAGNKEMFKIRPSLFDNPESKQGAIDACRYYRDYKTAGTAILFSTILLGAVGGVIPAIGVSATPPQKDNLNIPDTPMNENIKYVDAYREQAHRIKKLKVWNNYGDGIVILVGTLALGEYIYLMTHKPGM